MKTIYRYELPTDKVVLEMPCNAKVIHIDTSYSDKIGHKIPSLWCEVDTEYPTEQRTFVVVGTGADIDFLEGYKHNYLGTALEKDKYAFHVYEVHNYHTFGN